MTTVEASCSACGDDIRLAPAQIVLFVSPYEHRSYYVFTCTQPNCGKEIRKPADAAIRDLLINNGAVVCPLSGRKVPAGPPITYDDVLDFVLALDGVDLLAATLDPRVGT